MTAHGSECVEDYHVSDWLKMDDDHNYENESARHIR
jgi:hypothetical protein